MLYIYSNLKIKNNDSEGPTGLLKWIFDLMLNKNIKIKIINAPKKLNQINNQSILIYPSNLMINISNKVLKNNRIICLGPDSNSLEILSLVNLWMPKLHKFWLSKIFTFFLIKIFDRFNIKRKITTVLVGEEDVKLLSKFKKNIIYLPHPFLSSINNITPLISKPNNEKDLIIIGKLIGLPVGLKDMSIPILNYLIPLIEKRKTTLYIFESTGLKLPDYIKDKNKYVKIIKRKDKLANDFFQGKLVINLSLCGAGTANRSLSTLYDGGYLFSSFFGVRNINIRRFKNQIYVSKYTPLEKNFYEEIDYFLECLKISDNREYIKLFNQKCEKVLFEITQINN